MVFLILLFASTVITMYFIKWYRREAIPENTDSKSWALVTGCTDGIGRSFAIQLAKKNYNIILIGRNIFKLDKLQKHLVNEYNTKTVVLVVDFTRPGNFFQKFAHTIKLRKISIVVNNVGISYPSTMKFDDCDICLLPNIVKCNISTITNLTYYIINLALYENQHITFINVSSILGVIPAPYYSLYGASKAFVSKFTQDLSYEYRHTNIKFICLKPWLVSTKMSKTKPGLLSPTPDEYVSNILKWGSYFPHDILTLISKLPLFDMYFRNVLYQKYTKTEKRIQNKNK